MVSLYINQINATSTLTKRMFIVQTFFIKKKINVTKANRTLERSITLIK